MPRRRITIIQGDGIGPEIMESTLAVFDKIDCSFDYDYADAGAATLHKNGEIIPEKSIRLIEKNGILLKGPISYPPGQSISSINMILGKRFNLFASMRPAVSFPNSGARFCGLDLMVVRENTEGMYSGEGQSITPDGSRAEALSIVTRKGSVQLLDYTYEMAKRLGRKKVTIVHKADVMKTTSGLFLEVARTLAQKHPEVETIEMNLNHAAMDLVIKPESFDIIATTNLYGDILSDLCSGLVGGHTFAPGASIGLDYAMFETVHGSAPDIAGKGIANPSSLILAGALLLDHLDLGIKARIIRKALRDVFENRDRLTPDMGGTATTQEFTAAILDRL